MTDQPSDAAITGLAKSIDTLAREAASDRKKGFADFIATLRKVAVDLLIVALFPILLVSAYVEMTDNAVIVFSISVPESLQKVGYTSLATTQRVSEQMGNVIYRSEEGGTSAVQSATGLQQILGSNELPDIQMPGQGFSFRNVVQFLRDELGFRTTTLSINIAEDERTYTADIRVVGPYGRSSETVRVSKEHSVDELLSSVAANAVKAASPMAYALFVADRRGRPCPIAVDCTVDSAISAVSPLLRNGDREDDALVHLVLSEVLLRAGDPSEAERHCRISRTLDSTLVRAYVTCAYALAQQRKSKEAVEYAKSAAGADIRDVSTLASLGDILIECCRDDAQQQYNAALKLDPRHVYSMIGLGTIAMHATRYQEAVAHYRAALLLNPVEPYANGALGAALVEQNAVDEAIPHLRKSLAVLPKYEVALRACAKIKVLRNIDTDPCFDPVDQRQR